MEQSFKKAEENEDHEKYYQLDSSPKKAPTLMERISTKMLDH